MVSVRDARRDDYDGLCTVIKEVDMFHADAIPHFFRHFEGAARSPEWFTDALDNPDSLLLVAEREGSIVGFLWGLVRSSPDTPMHVPRRWLLVDMLGVAETHRGQGIGRTLMEHAQLPLQRAYFRFPELPSAAAIPSPIYTVPLKYRCKRR
jgi:ribosomal protein S18 acetylase RimI-like enzyme